MSARVIAGRFVLGNLLGRGGMSEVWLAEDRELGRPVALKLLAGGADPVRLVREARAIAALSHPNIAAVYDVGEAEGRPYIVLEYLPGGSLEDRLSPDAPLADWQTERVARQIAAGLTHAHAAGVVHRDLKPSNVLFDAEARAKLADFGIARAAGQATITEAGTVMGTAAYLAPEQAAGEDVGPPADVYSFGVILFRLLTGRLPFTGTTPLEVALKHRQERTPAVASLRSDAPPALATLAERALAKTPEARPRDGRELSALLDDPTGATVALTATGATVALPRDAPAPPPTTPIQPAGQEPPPRTNRGRLALVLLLLALLAAGGIAAAVLLTGGGDTPADTSPKVTTTETQTQTTTEPPQQTTTEAPPQTTTDTPPTTNTDTTATTGITATATTDNNVTETGATTDDNSGPGP